MESLLIGPQLFLGCRRDEQVGRIGLIHQAVGRANPVVSSFESDDEVCFVKRFIPCEHPGEIACLRDEQEGGEGNKDKANSPREFHAKTQRGMGRRSTQIDTDHRLRNQSHSRFMGLLEFIVGNRNVVDYVD